MSKIYVSDFVRRQTRTSEFSYYNGSFEDIASLAQQYYDNGFYKNGYRPDVKLVQVPANGFYSSTIPMTDEIEYETVREARQIGEEPVTKRIAYGTKMPASFVDIVLYHKTALMEDPAYTPLEDGDYYEVISVNARSTTEEEPMTPITMARNQLVQVGGTKANYSGDEFAKSIIFWNRHIKIRERP